MGRVRVALAVSVLLFVPAASGAQQAGAPCATRGAFALAQVLRFEVSTVEVEEAVAAGAVPPGVGTGAVASTLEALRPADRMHPATISPSRP